MVCFSLNKSIDPVVAYDSPAAHMAGNKSSSTLSFLFAGRASGEESTRHSSRAAIGIGICLTQSLANVDASNIFNVIQYSTPKNGTQSKLTLATSVKFRLIYPSGICRLLTELEADLPQIKIY